VQQDAAAETRQCAECADDVLLADAVRRRAAGPRGEHLLICADCAATLDARYQAELEQPELLHGLFLGLIFGFLGAIAWFLILVTTSWEIGFVAIGLGYLVGLGVARGAGRKRGRKLQWLAVLATVVVMLFTEYLIGRHAVSRILVEQGYPPMPLLVPAPLVLAVLVTMLSDLATLALWGFAFLAAWSVPRPRRLYRA
jgi:hypothetical protein